MDRLDLVLPIPKNLCWFQAIGAIFFAIGSRSYFIFDSFLSSFLSLSFFFLSSSSLSSPSGVSFAYLCYITVLHSLMHP